VDAGGRPLVIAIEGQGRPTYDRLLAPAERLLSSLRIAP